MMPGGCCFSRPPAYKITPHWNFPALPLPRKYPCNVKKRGFFLPLERRQKSLIKDLTFNSKSANL